jgi:hypothetical protein
VIENPLLFRTLTPTYATTSTSTSSSSTPRHHQQQPPHNNSYNEEDMVDLRRMTTTTKYSSPLTSLSMNRFLETRTSTTNMGTNLESSRNTLRHRKELGMNPIVTTEPPTSRLFLNMNETTETNFYQ